MPMMGGATLYWQSSFRGRQQIDTIGVGKTYEYYVSFSLPSRLVGCWNELVLVCIAWKCLV